MKTLRKAREKRAKYFIWNSSMKMYSLFRKGAKWMRKQREVSGKSKVGILSIEPVIGKARSSIQAQRHEQCLDWVLPKMWGDL